MRLSGGGLGPSRGPGGALPRRCPTYTRTGDPPGTWEGRGCAALGVSGTVEAEVAERLYQEGVAPGGERIIQHAAPKTDEDQAAAEALAVSRYREEHPFASASEINTERTRIRAKSPGISRPYYDVTSSAGPASAPPLGLGRPAVARRASYSQVIQVYRTSSAYRQ